MSFVAKIITDLDNRGITQATRQFGKFNKTVLGVSLGLTAATGAAVRFSKVAVKAALEDLKAQALLNKTLENGGWGTAAEQVSSWIDATQRATGVADSELRPAFTTLFNAIGDVAGAQQLLNVAMDVSVGTGKDLSSVTGALAKAMAGQRTALTRLGTGLDSTTIKSADLTDVIDMLGAKFSGQTLVAAETLTGRINRLQIAADEAQETIGVSLVDAFVKIAGNGDISKATENIDNFATKVSNGIGKAVQLIEDFQMGWAFIMDPTGQQARDLYASRQASKRADQERTRRLAVKSMYEQAKQQKALRDAIAKTEAARKASEKASAAKAAVAAAKARAAAAQKARQDALDKQNAQLAMKYDTDRAGIMLALSKTESFETRQRLTDMLALNTAQYAQDLGLKSINATWALINAQVELYTKKILDSNAAAEAAAKAANSIAAGARAAADAAQAASQAAGNMSTSVPNLPAGVPASAAGTAAAAAQTQIPALVDAVTAAANTAGTTAATTPTNATPDVSGSGVSKATGGSIYGGTLTQSGPAVVLNINGSVIAQQDLTTAVGEAVNRFVRLGGKLVPLE